MLIPRGVYCFCFSCKFPEIRCCVGTFFKQRAAPGGERGTIRGSMEGPRLVTSVAPILGCPKKVSKWLVNGL